MRTALYDAIAQHENIAIAQLRSSQAKKSARPSTRFRSIDDEVYLATLMITLRQARPDRAFPEQLRADFPIQGQ
jgi:hypothetical protein